MVESLCVGRSGREKTPSVLLGGSLYLIWFFKEVSFRLVLSCVLHSVATLNRYRCFAHVSFRLALKLILVLPAVLNRLVLKLTVQSGYKYYRFTTVLNRLGLKLQNSNDHLFTSFALVLHVQ